MIIAIDGPAGSGKSTLAKGLAMRLGINYVDTGAMYRALTWYFLERGVDLDDISEIEHAIAEVKLECNCEKTGDAVNFHIVINGRDVSEEVREYEVSRTVSAVSRLRPVREYLVKLQREAALQGDLVMEGRDIGTVVFPEAEIKFFLSAETGERIKRRRDDYRKRGVDLEEKEMEHEISGRDKIDSSRDNSPLKKADDAIIMDTTATDEEAVLEWALALVRSKM